MNQFRSMRFALSVFCVAFVCSCGESGGDPGTGGGNGLGGSGGTGGTSGGDLTIRGTVSTPLLGFVDGDTADPNNPRVDNNAFNFPMDVQPIGNPSIGGGYLGPLDGGLDVADVYVVSLAEGQTATLFVADPEQTDFELFLFDADGFEVGASQSVGEIEQVIAPSSGTFYVVATLCFDFPDCAFGDDTGGLYNLSIGSDAGALRADQRLSHLQDFIEGDVLVAEASPMVVPKSGRAGAWYPMTDDLDIRLSRGAPAVERWQVQLRSWKLYSKAGAPRPGFQRAASHSASVYAVKELRKAGVSSASLNYRRYATFTPDDEFYSVQWHYPIIGLPQAWDFRQGDGVIVAVIDTGIVPHPDLAGQTVPGYDFVSDVDNAADGDGIDPDPTDPGDLRVNGQSSFHGTHVAGTVAARTNNGIGVAGVAFDARVMPIRVLGRLGGSSFDICQAILFAAGLENDSGTVPAQPADVLNLSLGGPGAATCEDDAIAAARAAGSIVVVAAGNDNADANGFSPANVADAITVSATGPTNNKAGYSNFGTRIDVAAPGGDMATTPEDGVASTMADDNLEFFYQYQQGTSMAAPHMAGVVALMKDVYPALTADDLDLLLEGTHPLTSTRIAVDLGAPGFDSTYGYGLIDAVSAVRAAGEVAEAPAVEDPVIRVSPLSLDVTDTFPQGEVVVRNVGVGDLAVSQVTADVPWLSVDPTVGTDETYTVTADPTGLDDGVYQGAITFDSNGGTVAVQVTFSVGITSSGTGEVGTLYVVLVSEDSQAGEALPTFATNAALGYEYSFEGVSPGVYALFAGTDFDGNLFIDDVGEALGGYPTLTEPLLIEITEDTDGLDFTASYDLRLRSSAGADPASPLSSAGSDAPDRARRLKRATGRNDAP